MSIYRNAWTNMAHVFDKVNKHIADGRSEKFTQEEYFCKNNIGRMSLFLMKI